MPSLTAVLYKLRQVYLLAIKTLMRGTSLLYTGWYMAGPGPVVVEAQSATKGVVKETNDVREFTKQVEALFIDSTSIDFLASLSLSFQQQFKQSLKSSMVNMLPSYNHQLPSGSEQGRFLALDVGGSTFRVAVVELQGDCLPPDVLRRKVFKIQNEVKGLKGRQFFEWMAERIVDTLGNEMSDTEVLPMGMAWSFPIEQTSLRSGALQPMGKGFLAAHGLLGADLGNLIQEACESRGLRVELQAIVNDSSATLLSKAYDAPTTRFGLILGTGCNVAAHLPVSMIGTGKYGIRPAEWFDAATHVLVNTEMSMFGKGYLPLTRWDLALQERLPNPDFQPLEYMISGHYLGEIIRQILIEGIQTAGIMGGVIPATLTEPYSLDTEVVAKVHTTTMEEAIAVFNAAHPSATVLDTDITALRQIAKCVTTRAAGAVSAGIHGLWQIRNEAEDIQAADSLETVIAYNGSVVESYPEFRSNVQAFLDLLVERSGGVRGMLKLTPATDSSLLGAAVAAACVAMGEQ